VVGARLDEVEARQLAADVDIEHARLARQGQAEGHGGKEGTIREGHEDS